MQREIVQFKSENHHKNITKMFKILLFSIFLITQNNFTESRILEPSVDIVCSTVASLENSPELSQYCESASSIDSQYTFIKKVLHANGSEVDTCSIKWLKLTSSGGSVVKYVPAGIKNNFPRLTILKIENSKLMHLEREDMRQFGDDIIEASFHDNKLTALEGNIFEFNRNLKVVSFSKNPLKYINNLLFQSFTQMTDLKWAYFEDTDCLNKSSNTPRNINSWTKATNCSSACAESYDNQQRIEQRRDFFEIIFPEIKIHSQVDKLIGKLERQKVEIKHLKRKINFLSMIMHAYVFQTLECS